MTKHYVDIAGKWSFILAYEIELTDLDEIASWLEAIGCDEESIRKACRVAMGTNSGFTFTNSDLKMSIMVISKATSMEQWFDTLVHEIDHLQGVICKYYDIKQDTEDAAYLQGYIMRKCIMSIKSD